MADSASIGPASLPPATAPAPASAPAKVPTRGAGVPPSSMPAAAPAMSTIITAAPRVDSTAAAATQQQAPPTANPVVPAPALFHFECLRCGFSSKQSSKTVLFLRVPLLSPLNLHSGVPSLPLGASAGLANQA
jgi:hypothetical protein